MNMVQFKASGKTYLDTIIERRNRPVLTIVPSCEVDEGYKATPETIMFFGSGFSNEDYFFLQSQYDDWTARYECNSKAQEELFKAICVAQLTIQVTQRGVRDVKEIEKAMKTFQDLLKAADLKPNRSAIETAGQETFGMLIKKLEYCGIMSTRTPTYCGHSPKPGHNGAMTLLSMPLRNCSR